jgi:rhomboid protease GluP
VSTSAVHPAGRSARWLDHDPVSRTLLALYLGMFIVEVSGAHSAWDLPAPQALALGASHALAVFGEGRYETLVTASFLHVGVVHVAFDALLVWQAGPVVERAIGSGRMAPIALAAGAAGNLLSAARGWLANLPVMAAGGTGALAGVLAAGCVIALRDGGWRRGRRPETGALLRWLAVVFAAGLVSRLTGQTLDTATLVGGALGGAAMGALWRRPLASSRASAWALAASAAVLLACIALVAIRDRADRFATMPVERRLEFTADAVLDGRCGDAADGLRSLDRLRVPVSTVSSLRAQVEASCGRTPAAAAPISSPR